MLALFLKIKLKTRIFEKSWKIYEYTKAKFGLENFKTVFEEWIIFQS